ncbi:MAG: hypothetical protein WC343_00295 [Bacilli bacterium]|jgi:hypothetical protein
MSETKRCTKCGEEKPLTEFYRDRTKSDGRKSWCKLCTSGYQREYYEENREKRAGQRPRRTFPLLRDRAWMERKLLRELLSVEEIAAEVGCSPATARSAFRDLDISIPPAAVRELFRSRIGSLSEGGRV